LKGKVREGRELRGERGGDHVTRLSRREPDGRKGFVY
jgi:hypothetical protein